MHPEKLKMTRPGIFGIKTVEKPKHQVDGIGTIGGGNINIIACLHGPTYNKEHVTAIEGWYPGNK